MKKVGLNTVAYELFFIEQYKKATPKSPIGKALDYSMKRWKELSAYTTDGRLEIETTRFENEIRQIALGRKNYLFADRMSQFNASR